MSGVLRRLARLEGLITPVQRHDDGAPERERLATNLTNWVAGWGVLSQTMDPDHVGIVEAEVPDWWKWTGHRDRVWLTFHFGQFTARSHLAYQVCRMVQDAVRGTHRGPFTLPAEVASIYVADDRASPNDQCGACGYHLLSHTGWSNVRGGHGGVMLDAAYAHFDACPLCGGPVGCNMFFRLNDRRSAPTYQLPPDRLSAVRGEVTQYLETIETFYTCPDDGRN